MGFWDTLKNAMTAVGEMNEEAVSNAAKLSVDALCEQVNSVNVLLNPLIYTSCAEELKGRFKKLTQNDLLNYFNEYESQERTDVIELIFEELKERGLVNDDDE